ncbi:MAG: HD domain-containing protein, partial [Spirochaetia bacterium]|nr:HD domain-containing protein [Spirochaetia bacterium]
MSESALFSSVASQFDHVIRDPVWGDIPMPESIFELTRAQPFLIADNIRQLGPVSMVYPGATHSRKAHSIGVYSLARRMLLALIERGQISFVSHEGARSFLVAALCHDLGHYPYAHSLKELPLTSHEALAGDIILEEPMRSLVG